jgi:hypothetical protein
MILEMPELLTMETVAGVHLPGQTALLSRDVDTYTLGWRVGSNFTTVSYDFANRRVTIPDDAPQELIDILAARLVAFGGPPEWDAAARQVLAVAQSAVGVDVRNLTAAQVRALLALVLFDKKAIGADLTIRPLREWVIRRPGDA